tara:strand:- start:268 stop:564 length:297 start_codon:yes stop_codon:yes gene_type:complete
MGARKGEGGREKERERKRERKREKERWREEEREGGRGRETKQRTTSAAAILRVTNLTNAPDAERAAMSSSLSPNWGREMKIFLSDAVSSCICWDRQRC